MAETRDYDLATLIDGSVASIEPKLIELSDAELTQLAELERGGKTRSTLLAAIEAEQKGRADAAALLAGAPLVGEVILPAGSDYPVVPGPDAGDADLGEGAEGAFPDAPLPEPGVNDALHPDLQPDGEGNSPLTVLRDALVAAGFTVELGESTLLVAADAITTLAGLAVLNDIDGLMRGDAGIMPPEGAMAVIELSAEADGETALVVMFEGVGGRPIPALGKLTFGPGDFLQDIGGRSRTLAKPIVFPADVAGTHVQAIWLLDADGEPWSRCALISALPVGGGRQATIPANYLRFDAPAQVKAAA